MTYKLPEPISRDDTEHNKDYYTAETTQKIADAAYAAGLAEGRKVPEGWKLVPIEPTQEMRTAGSFAVELHSHSPVGMWVAMLIAAPEPKP